MANSIVSGKAGNSVQNFDSMNTGRERMQAYAKGGGLMGYMEGGDVMDVY